MYLFLSASRQYQPLMSIHAIWDRLNVFRASNENVVKNPDPYLARRSVAGEIQSLRSLTQIENRDLDQFAR